MDDQMQGPAPVRGLTTPEAASRLTSDGPNALPLSFEASRWVWKGGE